MANIKLLLGFFCKPVTPNIVHRPPSCVTRLICPLQFLFVGFRLSNYTKICCQTFISLLSELIILEHMLLLINTIILIFVATVSLKMCQLRIYSPSCVIVITQIPNLIVIRVIVSQNSCKGVITLCVRAKFFPICTYK